MSNPLLTVSDLSVTFTKPRGLFRHATTRPVEGCSLDILPGEFVAVVGESGAGKSLLAHAIMGILPADAQLSGSLSYRGAALGPQLPHLRGDAIQFIPQSVNNLDPTMTVGQFVGDPARLAAYGIADLSGRYPHELSGGQLRRVLLSTIKDTPKLIIADEPTPGIDASALSMVKESFASWHDRGCAILMITHDFPLAMELADRIAVFKDGRIIDTFTPSTLVHEPSQCGEYSRALWDAQPVNWQVPA